MLKFEAPTDGVKADLESPLTIDEDFSAFAVGLPARGGMDVYSLNGRVVIDFGKEVDCEVPNDCGPRLAGCNENVTS